MLKRLFVLPCLLSLFLFSNAQEDKGKDLNLDFYGFVRNEAFVDTYKGFDGASFFI